ncbi:hypothetical protein [Rhodococcus sp. UFZ-B548]|uniref:hypothetical protein n=1 Tax=Rhodococcus sp. UFZ-B548 TaxID=2742212 RepID=UPI0015F50CE4|nr:hypothetical protein [Rhodococcus sp. UFZ-B548]
MVRAADFIKQVVSSTLYRPDGTVETRRDPAVWTLAHRGYSGSGRLDIWVYRTQADALRAGAVLAMECGMDEDRQCTELFAAGRWAAVLQRYEERSPDDHLLRVQAAFLQPGQGQLSHH